MKRPINFFDAATLMIIYILVTREPKPFPLWIVFFPYAFEAAWGLVRFLLRLGGQEEDLAVWAARMFIRLKSRIIARRIKKDYLGK